jgi:hypothetical protein
MDKKILVEKIKEVISAYKAESKVFSFVGLIPVYPDSEKTSYILMVSATWLKQFDCNQSIAIITRKLFDVLDKKTLKLINRVEIYDNQKQLHCISDELIFEDTIGFKEYYNEMRNFQNFAVH